MPFAMTPGRALLLSRTPLAPLRPAGLPSAAPDFAWERFEIVILPAGDVVARTYTAQGLERDTWIRTRHAAAVRALVARGLPYATAWWAAVALMGHWANETGWGRAEIDYGLGNIRAGSGWTGDVHYLQGTDDPQSAPYRAYGSLDEGVEDNVRLATGTTRDGTLASGSRYQPAFLALLGSDGHGPFVVTADGRTVAFPLDVVQWHADLTRAGWHPYSEASQSTYRSTVTRVAQTVGAPPAESAVSLAKVGAAVGVSGLAVLLAWMFWPSGGR